jgi:hypothetical protein
MPIGEAGSLTRGGFGDGEVVRIDFTEPLQNAVLHLSSTNFGGNEFSLRVVSVDNTGFSFSLEEWEDEDGPHPANEIINWLAVEEGVHTLPDGRVIEAGTVNATTTASSAGLSGTYSDPPVVLTNVMSTNDSDVVDSDPLNVTSTGFDVRLQEGSQSDGVNTGETVGFIAMEAGGDGTSGYAAVAGGLNSGNNNFNLGGSLTDGVVLGETQTINESDAGNVVLNSGAAADGRNGTINAKFDEETGDGEDNHGNETVGFAGFEDGVILCFCAGTRVDTKDGPRPVETLRNGDLVQTQDHGLQPVRQVLRRRLTSSDLANHPKLRPVRILAGALGCNVPSRDLCVSRQDRMLVNSRTALRMFDAKNVLVAAIRLTEMPGIFVDTDCDEVEYVHLLFDRHEIIFAEGAPSESMYLGAEAIKALPAPAQDEIRTLFPDLDAQRTAVPSARMIPSASRQKQLLRRMSKNAKTVLEQHA